MGRNANTSTTNSKGKEKDAFIEFDYSSGANAASGRIYLDNENVQIAILSFQLA